MTTPLTPQGPPRLTRHAAAGMGQHRATWEEAYGIVTAGRRHRRGDLAVIASDTSDLRVLVNTTTHTVVAVWRGARNDGPWATALVGRPRRQYRRRSWEAK